MGSYKMELPFIYAISFVKMVIVLSEDRDISDLIG
ncbi:Uncharacterised protein [Legionella sainthelensi]|nr:Uncharacterised protein [Legionella sainthelensi]